MRQNQHILLPNDISLRKARIIVQKKTMEFMVVLAKEHRGVWRELKRDVGYNMDDLVKNQFTVAITYTNE